MDVFRFKPLLLITVFLCTVISDNAIAKDQGETIKYTREYTIEESYEFFDRRQTPFKKDKLNLSKKKSQYLDNLFFVTDLLLKARVNMMQYYFSGTHIKHIKKYNDETEVLLNTLSAIEAP